MDDDGYVLIYTPDHPHSTKAGHVREHRLVMEKILGRYLQPSEVVHHKDDNPSNNDPSNLRLYGTNADHLRDTLTGKIPNWSPEAKDMIRQGVIRSSANRPGSNRRESGTDDPSSP